VIAGRELAQQMAENGLEMNLDIDARYRRLLKELPGTDPFVGAVALSLTWTGHAVDSDRFCKSAVSFINNGRRSSLSAAQAHAARFGPDALGDALESWRTILMECGGSPDLDKSGSDLRKAQDRLHRQSVRLDHDEEISGIGAWLFCAPFKIIIANRRDLWEDPGVDEVLMPLGLEVVRGIKKLVKARSKWTTDIEMGMLIEEEGGLQEGMGTVCIVQHASKKIAADSESRVVHINSGLYALGKGLIEED